mgnify:CR=1 FL=1
MFEKSAAARHRNAARVTVRLAGEPPFEAFVFLKVDERLIDLLNDARQFIPIKRADGATMIASKQNIVSIIEQPEEEPQEAPAPDPLDRRVRSALGRQMARRVPGARTTVARIRRTGRRMLVEAEVVASRALTRADADAVAAILRRFVHPGLDLTVRSRVGADFSAP